MDSAGRILVKCGSGQNDKAVRFAPGFLAALKGGSPPACQHPIKLTVPLVAIAICGHYMLLPGAGWTRLMLHLQRATVLAGRESFGASAATATGAGQCWSGRDWAGSCWFCLGRLGQTSVHWVAGSSLALRCRRQAAASASLSSSSRLEIGHLSPGQRYLDSPFAVAFPFPS